MLLTNGAVWQAHRLKFDKPISAELAFELDLLQSDAKPNVLIDKLFLISREAGGASAIDSFWHRREATSRYVIAQILLSAAGVGFVRSALRSHFRGLKIGDEEVSQLLCSEVIKREILEGDKAGQAERLIKRAARRRAKDALAPAAAPAQPAQRPRSI